MRIRRYLTYPHVVSSLALFIALGGSAYAVTQIDPNSVGTKQLKANAVKSGKIANGTIKREDAKAGAFATPPQLAGKLGVGATAANSAKLGGIAAAGFQKGNGTAFSAEYDINFDDVVTIPGGAKITVQCGTSGHILYFESTSGTWDVYEFRYVDNDAQPNVTHVTRNPNDLFIIPGAAKEAIALQIDAKRSGGPSVSLALFARFDDTTDHCIGRVRGVSFPN